MSGRGPLGSHAADVASVDGLAANGRAMAWPTACRRSGAT